MVSVDGFASDPRPVAGDVIQGTVLGPLLFLMHINCALNSISHDVYFLFADDTKMVCSFESNAVSTAIRETCAYWSALDDS